MDRIESRSHEVYQSAQEGSSAPVFNLHFDILYGITKYLTPIDLAAFAETCKWARGCVSHVIVYKKDGIKQASLIKNFINLYADNLDKERFQNEIKSLVLILNCKNSFLNYPLIYII